MADPAGHTPTILFGLGATKAGSSWLHDHLASHPEVHMPALKELHYFDAKFFRTVPAQIRRLTAEREAIRLRMAAADDQTGAGLAIRDAEIVQLMDLMSARVDEGAFARFLTTSAAGARLVGDITPAYALLPARLLRRMQRLADRVRFVYILRDPVDRLWSHVRMLAARLSRTGEDFAAQAHRIFDRWAGGGQVTVSQRSDYAGALERMARSILPERSMVLYYERLFSDETTERLAAFLGISNRRADFARRVHAGIPLALDPVRRDMARAILRPQYEYVARTRGDLPARWRENMGE